MVADSPQAFWVFGMPKGATITSRQWECVFSMLRDGENGGLWGALTWLHSQGHTLGFSTFQAQLRIERETRRIAGVNASEALTATAAVPMLDAVPLEIDAPLCRICTIIIVSKKPISDQRSSCITTDQYRTFELLATVHGPNPKQAINKWPTM